MAQRRDDMELMQQFDGELPGELSALTDDEARKLQAIEQIGEAVRSHLELAADDAEPALDTMWARIEGALGAPAGARDVVAAAQPAAAQPEGLFTRMGRWLDRHRGHVFTGAACAAAAAVLVVVLRPPRTVTTTRIVEVPVARTQPAQSFASSPAVVEDLDVVDGAGMVLTVPGDEGENPTTVIWVTRDDMEGPI